ncbi:MAG: hypothetical protein E7568_01560 [Ruminococcaceae bacterium]|nr:hypothetical protein [Oscillospiraceae bacterium]
MNEISLSGIFAALLKRIWLIIIVTVLCAAIAFSYCKFIVKPVYRATTSILITNGGVITESGDDTIKSGDLSASIYLVNTCVDILKSQKIYKELAVATSDKYNYKSLKSGFTVEKKEEDSLFINISFRSTDKSEAILLANAFTQLVPSSIEAILPSVKVEILEEADTANKVFPQTINTTFIFALIGAIVSCAIILLISFMDQTIKSEEEFVSYFDIPILGTVPDFDNSPTYAYKAKSGNVSTTAGGQ